MKNIIVVGGGFAGLNFISKIGNKEGFNVTLIDKNNYNFFPPLIYQVGSSILSPSSISYPFRGIIKNKKNVHFIMDELLAIHPHCKTIETGHAILPYDCLILATGTKSNFFGSENIEKYSIPMKTLNDAMLLRNTFLNNMEKAVVEKDPDKLKALLTVVVAGGGPAGVEISGVLCEIVNKINPVIYKELRDKVYIYLVEGSNSLLASMSKKSQTEAYKTLTNSCVTVILNTKVKDCDHNRIILDNGQTIFSNMLIWTSGVTARRFQGLNDSSYGRSNRLKVDGFNRVLGYDGIFAIGDTCIITDASDEKFPEGHPQLAQVALQQGKNLAKNLIKKDITQWKPFKYFDMGTMAIIAKNKAVSDLTIPKVFLKGFISWLIWSCIHLVSLLSFGNKLITFIRWFSVYVSNKTSLGVNYKIGEK